MRPAHRPAARESLQRLPASRAGGIPHTRETDAQTQRTVPAALKGAPRITPPRESLQRHSRKPRPFPRIERRVVKGQLSVAANAGSPSSAQ